MGEEHRDREGGHSHREGEEGVGRPHQLGTEDQPKQRLRGDQRDQAQPRRRYRDQPERDAELSQRMLAPIRPSGRFGEQVAAQHEGGEDERLARHGDGPVLASVPRYLAPDDDGVEVLQHREQRQRRERGDDVDRELASTHDRHDGRDGRRRHHELLLLRRRGRDGRRRSRPRQCPSCDHVTDDERAQQSDRRGLHTQAQRDEPEGEHRAGEGLRDDAARQRAIGQP